MPCAWGTPVHHAWRGPPPPQAGEERRSFSSPVPTGEVSAKPTEGARPAKPGVGPGKAAVGSASLRSPRRLCGLCG